MDRLVLSLFDGFQARLESGPSLVVSTKKAQALLAYLACSPTESHSRDKLAALLWGESSQQCARHSLRQTLYVLRATLNPLMPAILRGDSSGVSLDRSRLIVDALEFERLAQEDALEPLERAGALYKGDFLAGIGAGDQTFEEWLRDERDRLDTLAFDVYAKLLALQREAGLIAKAVRSARCLLAIDPMQEVVHRVLMRLFMTQGRPEAARRQYEMCARMLRQEFGAEPQAETKALLSEITSRRFASKPRAGLMVDESFDSVHGRRKPGGRISRNRRSVSCSGAAPNSRRSIRRQS